MIISDHSIKNNQQLSHCSHNGCHFGLTLFEQVQIELSNNRIIFDCYQRCRNHKVRNVMGYQQVWILDAKLKELNENELIDKNPRVA